MDDPLDDASSLQDPTTSPLWPIVSTPIAPPSDAPPAPVFKPPKVVNYSAPKDKWAEFQPANPDKWAEFQPHVPDQTRMALGSPDLAPIPMPTEDAPVGMPNPQWNQQSNSWGSGPAPATPAAPVPDFQHRPYALPSDTQTKVLGKYSAPDTGISSNTGEEVAKDWEPLPASKDDLKSGKWYRLRRPDGTEYSAVFDADSNGFYPLDYTKQNQTPNPREAISWAQAVDDAHKGGWTTPGSRDVTNLKAAIDYHQQYGTQHPDAGVLHSARNLNPNDPVVAQALGEEGTAGKQLAEDVQQPGANLATTWLGGDNALARNVVGGFVVGGGKVLSGLGEAANAIQPYVAPGMPQPVNPQSLKQFHEDLSTLSGAQNYVSDTTVSSLSPGTQQFIRQTSETLTQLGLAGVAGPAGMAGFVAQSAGNRYYEAGKSADSAGLTGSAKDAYVASQVGIDVLTNALFLKYGAPYKAITDTIGKAASNGLKESIKALPASFLKGTGIEASGSFLSGIADKVAGIDTSDWDVSGGGSVAKGLRDKLFADVKQAAIDQGVFAAVGHVLGPAIRETPDLVQKMIDSPTAKRVAEVLGAHVSDPAIRQKVADIAAKQFEPAPDAGTLEGSGGIKDVTGKPEAQPTPETQVGAVGASGAGEVPVPNQELPAQETQHNPIVRGLAAVGDKINDLSGGRILKPFGVEPKGESNAPQARNESVNGEQKFEGTSPGTAPPENGEQLRGAESPQDRRSNSAQPSEVPREAAAQKVSPQAQELLDTLSERYGKKVIPTGPKTTMDVDARTFLDGLGVDTVFAEHENGDRLRAGDITNPGVAVLRAGGKGNDSFYTALAHAAAHGTGLDLGDHYEEGMIDDAAKRYEQRAGNRRTQELAADPVLRRREGTAEIMADFLKDKSFRDQLEKGHIGLWTKIVDSIKKVLGTFTPKDAAARKTLEAIFQRRKEVAESRQSAPEATPKFQLAPGFTEEQGTPHRTEDVQQEREDRYGLGKVPISEQESFNQWKNQAQSAGFPERATALSDEILSNPRPLTPTESAGMRMKLMDLENAHKPLAAKLASENLSPDESRQIEATLKPIQQEYDKVSQAWIAAGSEWGRGGVSRQKQMADDYSLLAVRNKAKAAKGEELTPKETKELDTEANKHQQISDRLEKIKQTQEGIEKEKTKQTLKKIEREGGDVGDKAGKLRTVLSTDAENQAELDSLKSKLKAATPDDLKSLAQKFAKEFVKQGVRDPEELADKVHAEIKKALPDITRQQTADAISGYGDYKLLNKDKHAVILRDLKGQLQQLAKLEDMKNKQAPKKTGIERRTPSDEERGLIQQVNEAKKKGENEGWYEGTDPAKRLKSTLEGIKTRLRNQIKDFEKQIEDGVKSVKDRTKTQRDAEALDLERQRDEAKERYETIFGKKEMTDEQRAAVAKKAVQESIDEYERRIKEGDFSKPEKKEPIETPELQAARAQRDALQKQYQLADPNPPALQRAMKRGKDLEEHLAKGTLPEAKGRPVPEDQRLVDAAQRNKELQQAVNQSDPAVKKRLQKSIDSINERIASGDVMPKKKEQGPQSAEVERLAYEKARSQQKMRQIIAAKTPKTIPQRIYRGITEPFNLARSLITSVNFHQVFRQGGLFTFAHPIEAAKNMPDMIRAMASPVKAHAIDESIHARPNAPLYRRAGLYLAPTDINAPLTHQEEAFMSNLRGKIPLLKGSERGYTTFLNLARADLFDSMYGGLASKGTPEEAQAIAHYVNAATGRGGPKSMPGAATAATVFFSPRYVISRFQLAAGEPMWHGTSATRKAVATEYARYIAGVGSMVALGAAAGGKLELDPRSSDFMKLQFGNTRLDLLGGLSQVMTFVSRLGSGETKKLNGDIAPIRGQGVPFGGTTAPDVISRYLRSKLSPLAGFLVDLSAGKDYMGNEVTPASSAQQLLIPMTMRQILPAIQDQGLPKAAAMSLLNQFGIGLEVYQQKQGNAKSADQQFISTMKNAASKPKTMRGYERQQNALQKLSR